MITDTIPCEICGCPGNMECTNPPDPSWAETHDCALNSVGVCTCCKSGINRMESIDTDTLPLFGEDGKE